MMIFENGTKKVESKERRKQKKCWNRKTIIIIMRIRAVVCMFCILYAFVCKVFCIFYV